MHKQGAELAFTYQNERLLKNIKEIADACDSNILIECDVSDDESIKSSFKSLKEKWTVLMVCSFNWICALRSTGG